MNTKDYLGTLEKTPSAPVWVASAALNSRGRKDIREFFAKSTDNGDTKTFIFDDTCRYFDRARFTLDTGCELRDSTGHYRCIQMIPFKMSKRVLPMLITQRIP